MKFKSVNNFFCIILIFVSVSTTLHAQNFEKFNEKDLQLRVKQLDEFRKRFNYETSIDGNKISAEKFDTLIFKRNLVSLFDYELISDTTNTDIINEFMYRVISKYPQQKIRFTDSCWYAEVECKVNFLNKTELISLILQPEKTEQQSYKWSIRAVKSILLSLDPIKKNPGLMISPVDNEINFMSLPGIFETQKGNISNYTVKNFQPEELNTFLFLVKNGLISNFKTEKVRYHFLQIPEYIFIVESFERDNFNKGWLISDIITASELNKYDYLNKKLNIRE